MRFLILALAWLWIIVGAVGLVWLVVVIVTARVRTLRMRRFSMRIGTKSVLFGAHCFALHWFFVALGWWKLHGFKRVLIGGRAPRNVHEREALDIASFIAFRDLPGVPVMTSILDPRLWVAFFVHDLGYIGKPNMDGPEGETHPELGAAIMRRLFGQPWGDFAMYHSRFLAKQHGVKPSPLCIADKLAIALEPWWLYLPRVNLTGEVREYMAKSAHMNETGGKYSGMNLNMSSQRAWNRDMCAYIRRWVAEHKDGRDDTWTPDTKRAVTASGVWE